MHWRVELKQAAQGILYWLTYEICLKQAHGRHYGSHINEIALLVYFTISFKTNWDTYSLRIISCLVQVLSHNFSPPRPPPRSMLLCCMQKL